MGFGNTWRYVLALITMSCVVALPGPSAPDYDWKPEDIITRDVAIIGGGASGTYAAVRIRDMNQSVVIVEKKDRLGGHTETYTDPVTGATIDIGVVVWHDIDIVKNFFARFNVALVNTLSANPGQTTPVFVDFRTGAVVANFIPSDPTTAFSLYAEQIAQYPYLDAGFDLPSPVPADLLLPFGDFATKHNLSAAVQTIFQFDEASAIFLTDQLSMSSNSSV
jgi:phytoene dehydrogenase-like protein